MKHLINLAFAIILTACAVSPQNPQQAIFQTKQNYELALTVAVAYDNLPTCGAGAPALCSDRAIRIKIKQAKDVASPAIQAAENAVRDPGFDDSKSSAVIIAAQQAVAALTAITASLKTK